MACMVDCHREKTFFTAGRASISICQLSITCQCFANIHGLVDQYTPIDSREVILEIELVEVLDERSSSDVVPPGW